MGTESEKNGDRRAISPARFSHAVLRTARLKEMTEWYQTVLNTEILYRNDFIVFMTFDDEHHRIALIGGRGLAENSRRGAGLDHLAFFYATMGEWIATYERLKAGGITPRVCVHHGITMSLYYRDPDNNGVELSIDAVEKSRWHEWMRDYLGRNPIGAPLDPDEIARKFHAGVPETELLRQPAGELKPEDLRRLTE